METILRETEGLNSVCLLIIAISLLYRLTTSRIYLSDEVEAPIRKVQVKKWQFDDKLSTKLA